MTETISIDVKVEHADEFAVLEDVAHAADELKKHGFCPPLTANAQQQDAFWEANCRLNEALERMRRFYGQAKEKGTGENVGKGTAEAVSAESKDLR